MKTGKKYVRKLLSLAVAMALTLTVALPTSTAYAAYSPKSEVKTILSIPADLSGKTVILHTNDMHGAISKYALVASVKENLTNRGAEVILVDAGDFSQGTPYVSTTKGADAVTMMNAAGYDIATLGNHEFDFGYYQLVSNLSKAKFKVISANVMGANGAPVFNPNFVYNTKSGVKIGFFGLETPETRTKVHPGLIQGISFLAKGDLVTCAQEQVDALKTQGVDR